MLLQFLASKEARERHPLRTGQYDVSCLSCGLWGCSAHLCDRVSPGAQGRVGLWVPVFSFLYVLWKGGPEWTFCICTLSWSSQEAGCPVLKVHPKSCCFLVPRYGVDPDAPNLNIPGNTAKTHCPPGAGESSWRRPREQAPLVRRGIPVPWRAGVSHLGGSKSAMIAFFSPTTWRGLW